MLGENTETIKNGVIVPGLGEWVANSCLCVLGGHSLLGKKQNKSKSIEIPLQSCESFLMFFRR